MPPGVLAQVLCHLPQMKHDDLLVGCDSFADAGVYRVRDDLALVQTLDFFSPVVDDPYTYGQIAAANALSDVYAMGAKPLTAMNIVCFPSRTHGPEILGEILKGGADKVLEAGALIVGGHSVEDAEPKYGLSVTGVVHPYRLVRNDTAKPGDILVLTKPIGSGLVLTAAKAEMAIAGALDAVVKSMQALNKDASEAMQLTGVHASTDITGFGLLGHAREMALASGVSMEISFGRVPLFRGALQAAGMGLVPGGAYANREYIAEGLVNPNPGAIGEREMDILCDPQTSGGLLISVCPEKERELLTAMAAGNVTAVAIGLVTNEQAGRMTVLP
jgi:selenide,water dikinase